MAELPPITFTVIGGFLGAGKTSLVNRILAAGGERRFAVLVNDFGALNIDEALIVSQTGKIMKLANGCICCSLAGGLIDAMLELMKHRDALDHILIEASGVSHPARIMDFARIDADLRPGLTLVLIDAEHFAEHAKDPQLAETLTAQIDSADVFLLTKTDIAAPERQEAARTLLRTRQPDVPVVDLSVEDEDFARFLVFDPAPDVSNTAALADHGHAAEALHDFASIAMVSNEPVDRAAFTELCRRHSARILRGKGILCFTDGAAVWQQTGRLMTIETVCQDAAGKSRIVVISPDDLTAVKDDFTALGFTAA
jgi:G3E family GTPase